MVVIESFYIYKYISDFSIMTSVGRLHGSSTIKSCFEQIGLYFAPMWFNTVSFPLNNRAIVLEHGNPSMTNQLKQLAAVESKFFLQIFI